MSSNVEPYHVAIPDSAIERLKAKLSLATFPSETSNANNWEYGVPLEDIKRLASFWTSYDWRQAEAKINKLPQFTTTISVDGHEDALKIHFVHQKAENPNSIPLLFCHGWPGSFLEVIKILPLLTSSKAGDSNLAFHVVAPSLPNYGFSQRTSKPGFGISQHAEVCHKLMLQLGYNSYVTQGGDVGFFITRAMGFLYPEHVLASHVNFVLAAPPSPLKTPMLILQYLIGNYTAAEKAGLERTQWFRKEGSGYNQVQSTKPHTLGFALADSPIALLAWIYEKLRDWSDDYPWTDEEIITWISIYYFSEAGADASVDLYYEIVHPEAATNGQGGSLLNRPIGDYLKWNRIPMGLSYFPQDVVVMPSSWGRTLGPVVFEKRHEEGGHFASVEKPELLVNDVKNFVKKAGISQHQRS
ncbi:uncharacterized protein JN550_001762 [Neoarthrinium moseri]|uniref:uncharacterized protein n=1 Tax=Neoarthrinium moseri TaxID=1658444 RepID=UPI001FDE7668|nr:uncharacterized protein JN550_001762 [Neoarthrinium moseri]KAI1876266.1 hypothetical protein JN550_001762 [Neoarthrinium moseri]